MDGATVHEDGIVVVEAVVAECLEVGLADGEQGQVVKAVADLVVAGDGAVLPRLFDIFDELGVELHLGQHRQEDLDWHLNLSLHQHAHSVVRPAAADGQPVLLALEHPGISL